MTSVENSFSEPGLKGFDIYYVYHILDPLSYQKSNPIECDSNTHNRTYLSRKPLLSDWDLTDVPTPLRRYLIEGNAHGSFDSIKYYGRKNERFQRYHKSISSNVFSKIPQ